MLIDFKDFDYSLKDIYQQPNERVNIQADFKSLEIGFDFAYHKNPEGRILAVTSWIRVADKSLSFYTVFKGQSTYLIRDKLLVIDRAVLLELLEQHLSRQVLFIFQELSVLVDIPPMYNLYLRLVAIPDEKLYSSNIEAQN